MKKIVFLLGVIIAVSLIANAVYSYSGPIPLQDYSDKPLTQLLPNCDDLLKKAIVSKEAYEEICDAIDYCVEEADTRLEYDTWLTIGIRCPETEPLNYYDDIDGLDDWVEFIDTDGDGTHDGINPGSSGLETSEETPEESYPYDRPDEIEIDVSAMTGEKIDVYKALKTQCEQLEDEAVSKTNSILPPSEEHCDSADLCIKFADTRAKFKLWEHIKSHCRKELSPLS